MYQRHMLSTNTS